MFVDDNSLSMRSSALVGKAEENGDNPKTVLELIFLSAW